MERISLKKDISKDIDKNFKAQRMNSKLQNIIKNTKLTEDEAKKNLSSLMDTISELENCQNCPGLSKCPNHIPGYVYFPTKDESKVTFNYIKCKKLKNQEKNILDKDSYNALLSARMKDIDTTDKNRLDLIKWLTSFYKKFDISKENKGLYLHGSFGSGKTFLIAALLNELKENYNIKYEIVYYPELLRTLKDDFNLLDSKVRYLSNVDILFIDDIGAEKVSDWSRDEILGTILQSRMNNHMTTFFSSNLSIDELEKHLSVSKDSVDIVKAKRIIERIKQLTVDKELISINRRK